MPIDPATALLLFVLFKASEKAIGYAGGKIADAMAEPIWDSVKNFGKSLAGKDETALRWKAFTTAFDESRERLLQKPRNPKAAQQLAQILEEYDTDSPYDPDWLDEISIELERASLLTEQPDINLITELCAVSLKKQGKKVDHAEFADTITDFVQFFQDSLFTQEVYQELMLRRAWWDKLKKPRYDGRTRYIEQVIKRYQDLDFVGIPELKDRQALRIEDVFISLQSEVETPEIERIKNALLDETGETLLDKTGEPILSESVERNIRAHLGIEAGQKIKRKLSTNQALKESIKLVILGDPGSGKTTLLKYIILAFAENKPERLGLEEKRLPIFIRLYDYVAHRKEIGKDGFAFTDYLNKFACDHFQLHLAPDFFQSALENGECCVCLDGLDELGGAGARREVTAAVAALINRYKGNRFIITSRIVGYDEAPLNRRDFPHHTIQPLSDDDIKVFVKKWYEAREKDPVVRAERITHLTKTTMDEPRIKSLATNPLMLTIIALVHRIEAELPHERVKLYDKCVTTLVETWDKVRGLKYDLRRRLLEQLAYWMHSRPADPGQPDERTRDVREGDLEIQLVRFLMENPRLALDEDQALMEAREFINLAKTRSGLLVERGEELYSFAHLTFQEYLAACDIEHSQIIKGVDGLWGEIEPKLHDSHWREVLLLLLGSLNRYDEINTELVRRILASQDDYEPALNRKLFFVARVLIDKVLVSAMLNDQIVEDLISIAKSKKPAREDAVLLLASMPKNTAMIELLQKLASGKKVNDRIRLEAAKALGQSQYTDLAKRLLNQLASDKKVSASTKISTARSLGEIGYLDEMKNILIGLVNDNLDNRGITGYLAARTLIEFGFVSSIAKQLQKLAKNSESYGLLRGIAIIALKDIENNDKGIFDDLLEIVREHHQGSFSFPLDDKQINGISGAAIYVLEHLFRERQTLPEKLFELVNDSQIDVEARINAVITLRELGYKEKTKEALLEILSDKEVIGYRHGAVIEALEQLEFDKETIESLILLVNNNVLDASISVTIGKVFGKLGLKDKALELLLKPATDENENPWLRIKAVRELGHLGYTNKMEETLRNLINKKEAKNWRIEAITELGKLVPSNEEVLTELLKFLEEKEYLHNQHEVLRTLGDLGYTNSAVLKKLKEITIDESVEAWVRSTAYDSLKKLLSDRTA